MPTYEYECKSCGHIFEAFQSINDPAISDCPQCGKEVRRLINGGGGIIFKGSGFYVTDKKSASGKEEKNTEKSRGNTGETKAACASCPASVASGGNCPASEKAVG